MKMLSRVVWSEGMHLAQHHFQQQSRYFEDLIAFSLDNLFFKPYGVAGLELDSDALRNGTVALTHARGILPDGLVFHFPEDPLPEPLEIRDLFSPTQESHLVLLAIAAYQPRQSNCTLDSNGRTPDARFQSLTRHLADETTGLDEKPVLLARKNFRLLLDVQAEDALVTLPLARVRRDGSGNFVYDPDHVPPCVRIDASPRLMQLLGRMVEVLDAKADSLLDERRASREAVTEYAAREIADYWLSHAIHSSLPPLRHLLQTRSCHPEVLYSELARLAGALCTFSLHSHPRNLPLYEHDQLDRCFVALERHIREHLEVARPTRCITIPLRQADAAQIEASSALDPQAIAAYREFLLRASPYFHLGAVADRRCLGRSHWFLAVRSSATPGEVIGKVPALVKVCSAKHIARLVKEAFPGLPVEHVPVPPNDLSPRVGTHYFRIQTAGPCWHSIGETAQVGVYVPAAIPDIELELAVLPES